MFSIDVKVWLVMNKYTQVRIAKDLGIKPQTVWKTINGKERNRKVLLWLKEHGYTGVASMGIDKDYDPSKLSR